MSDVFNQPFMFRNSLRDAVDRHKWAKDRYIELMFEQYVCLYEDIVEYWKKNGVEWPFKDPHDMTLEEFTTFW